MKSWVKRIFRWTPLRIAAIVTAVVVAADLTEPAFLQTIEVKALDAKFHTRGEREISERVAIIAIDDKSLEELGRWPWPRWTMAELLDELRAAEAGAVGFDIVFAEPDQNSELVKLRELRQLFRSYGLDASFNFADLPAEYAHLATDRTAALLRANQRFYRELRESEARANSDETLAKAIEAFQDRTILGYFFHGGSAAEQDPMAEGEVIPEGIEETDELSFKDLIDGSRITTIRSRGEDRESPTPRMPGVVPNIPLISKATPHAGHFYMIPDPEDGTIRWNHLVLRYEGDYYPSLGLKTASVALNAPIMIEQEHGNITEIRLGNMRVPTDERGRLLVNYAGPFEDEQGRPASYEVFSFTDIMHGRIPHEELRDKIFLIGPTAVGIYDLRNTPFSTMYPGVGIHANVIDNILTQDFLQKPTWMKAFDVGIILVLGLFLGLVLARLRSLTGALAAFGTAVAYYFFTQYAFQAWGIWLTTVYPLLEIAAVFAFIMTYKYMTEERQAKQIRGAFQSYVTPSVVESVLKDPDRLKLGGEMRELTVMFSDIRGFTSISEALSAEQLVDLLNNYLSSMTDLVFDSDGTLDKYIGDALMAIWGAPVVQEDHALRSCLTAIEMVDALENELKPRWLKDGLKSIPPGQVPPLDIGIGLNTGIMNVGNMGSNQRFDYTVMGDNVNLASRLEGTTKTYGVTTIISESTRQAVGDAIIVRELDLVRVKGRQEPVGIFELVGKAGQVNDRTLEKIALFEEGLGLYRRTEWDMAESVWRKLLAANPDDKTTAIFLKRIEAFRQNPVSADWDGVFEMTTK